MQADALHTLADVATLAKADIDPRIGRVRLSTTLVPDAVTAQYDGIYVHGRRWLPQGDVPAIDAEVSAAQLVALAGLFDKDDTIKVSLVKEGIRLVSPRHRVTLRTYPADEDPEPLDETGTVQARIPAQTLRREIALAESFVTTSIVTPILTGIRLSTERAGDVDELHVTACNGFAVLFLARIPNTAVAPTPWDAVIPARELAAGVKLLDGEVAICTSPATNNVVFLGESSWYHAPTLTGTWPNLSGINRKSAERQTLTLPVERLANALTALKVLGAPPTLSLRWDDESNTIILSTEPVEAGQYTTVITGETDFRGEVHHDSEGLRLIAQIADPLLLEVGLEKEIATRVRSEGRRAWLMPKVRTV